ncbi:MAG TPA: MFS transporter [Actinomycetota bacterium]|nr:MFS transporter [Actinomycetota bacterium]
MGAFDSLRYRDYRLLWTGAVLSNIGTWMHLTALSWYVFLLTRSAFWVSFATFANFVPTVLSPLAGVYTDEFDRKKMLVYTQLFMMVSAGVLAILVATHHANLFWVLALTFALGIGFTFNGTTWQAYMPSLVPPESMVNAIALNSAQFSVARVIGPAIAGVLLGLAGAGLIFGINAISFVAVLVALAFIRTGSVRAPQRRTVRDLLVGGFDYTWRHRRIRAMIVVIAVMSFFGSPVTALLPIFAADVFGRGAAGYGTLAAAMGVGSVLGALALGRRGHVTPRLIAGALVALGVTLILFASISVFWAGAGLLVLFGSAFLIVVSGTNSDIQLHVDEAMRGRAISAWLLAFGTTYPAGSLLAGLLAEIWGAPATMVVGGAVCAVSGLVLWWLPQEALRTEAELGLGN